MAAIIESDINLKARREQIVASMAASDVELRAVDAQLASIRRAEFRASWSSEALATLKMRGESIEDYHLPHDKSSFFEGNDVCETSPTQHDIIVNRTGHAGNAGDARHIFYPELLRLYIADGIVTCKDACKEDKGETEEYTDDCMHTRSS